MVDAGKSVSGCTGPNKTLVSLLLLGIFSIAGSRPFNLVLQTKLNVIINLLN